MAYLRIVKPGDKKASFLKRQFLPSTKYKYGLFISFIVNVILATVLVDK